MPGSCFFRAEWRLDDRFKKWIMQDSSKQRARCIFCDKSIDISSMGTSALRSHARGEKHQLLIKECLTATRITPFIERKTPKASGSACVSSSNPASELTHTKAVNAMVPLFTKTETLTAEIWWALKCASSGYSFNSSDDISHVWQQQFPDSVPRELHVDKPSACI